MIQTANIVNNVFVKDAVAAKESLVSDKEEAKELLETINKLESEIEVIKPSVDAREKYQELKTKKQTLSGQIAEKELSKANRSVSLDKNSNKLNEVIASIELYEKSKEAVETNKSIQEEIDRLNSLLSKVNGTQKSLNTEYMSAYSKKVSFADQISSLKKRIEETEKSEEELVHINITLQQSVRMEFHIISYPRRFQRLNKK